jgi:hypothetical protein
LQSDLDAASQVAALHPSGGVLTTVTHSAAQAREGDRFNRFRKLPVRCEKRVRSFLALNHIAAAILAFRKVSLKVHNFCG